MLFSPLPDFALVRNASALYYTARLVGTHKNGQHFRVCTIGFRVRSALLANFFMRLEVALTTHAE